MDIRFRPISTWPGERARSHKRAPFKATFQKTLDLLDRELAYLRAKDVIVEAGFDESDIRLDGWPRSSARTPAYPGIILSFDSKHGPLRYPCDRFATWKDNFRAIALALEALRKVDRYGVTKHAEQYTGWKQLPNLTSPNGFPTRMDAAKFIASFSEAEAPDIERDSLVARTAYKVAAKRVHPDGPGGSEAAFKGLQAARAMLGVE